MKTTFVPPNVTVEDLSKALYNTSLKLEQANQELLATSKKQLQLFNNISHDLRSPVSTLSSAIEYMMTLPDLNSSEGKELLLTMQSKINYLNSMINDLFLFSSMEASTKQLNLQTVNAGLFFEEFFYSCVADSKYNDRNLICEIPEQFPYNIEIDPNLILRVLDNLFNNALKYSSTGSSITCRLTIYKETMIRLDVEDTGFGILKEDLPHIFEHTYQANHARTPDNTSGCGLGLSIAQSIIKRHHGSIWCSSSYGVGSCFSFTLPIIMTKKEG